MVFWKVCFVVCSLVVAYIAFMKGKNDPIESLVKTVRKHGGFVNSNVEYKTGTRGRGMFAKERVKQGDLLFKIPYRLCVSSSTFHEFGDEADSQTRTLGSLLRNKEQFEAYVKSFPENADFHPSLWSSEEMKLLQNTGDIEV